MIEVTPNGTIYRFKKRVGFVSAGVGFLFRSLSEAEKRKIREATGCQDFIAHDPKHPDRATITAVKRPAGKGEAANVPDIR